MDFLSPSCNIVQYFLVSRPNIFFTYVDVCTNVDVCSQKAGNVDGDNAGYL